MKRFYSIVLLCVALMTVTSCFDASKILKFIKGDNVEEAEEVVEAVVEAVDEDWMYSNSYDGFTNVRVAPSAKSEVIGKLRNGDEYVIVISEEGNWYEVEYNGEIGYVHKDYVSERPSKPVTVDVDANWLQGVWSDAGYVYYVVFSNGRYACEQQYGTIGYGRWRLEENEIVFTIKHVTDHGQELDYHRGDENRFVIRKSARMLGDMRKWTMPSELEEGEDGITKSYFNALKKDANKYVK